MEARGGRSTGTEAKSVTEAPVEPPAHRTLLHRQINNLRTQNWTAIGLEFLMVVFGVFLGLEATNWNAGLSDRRDEAEALRPVSVTVRARGEAHGLSSFGAVDEQVLARQVAASPELEAMVESQLGWAVVHLQRIEAVDQIGAVLLERLDAEQGPERRP